MAEVDLPAASGLPFVLPQREAVRQLRGPAPCAGGSQALPGFERQWRDVVDFIVGITDEIWVDHAVGRIYDTYTADCVIYSSYGVTRGADAVVASTLATLAAFDDAGTEHLNVAWAAAGNGFYTSHLGCGRSYNIGPSALGPATGRFAEQRFAADCLITANRIHTEWLVRDAGAQVRQLGLNVDEVARAFAAVPPAEPPCFDFPGVSAEPGSVAAWATALFDSLWQARRFDRVGHYYARDCRVHSGGGRSVIGHRGVVRLLTNILAAIPDGAMRVDHVCHAEEGDGVIVAVRWLLAGTTRPGGVLGDVPAGRPATMMGVSHLRLAGGLIVEEWTVFDEVGVLVGAYRG